MNSIIATLILASPIIGVGGLTAITPVVKKRKYKERKKQYMERFPDGEELGYASVSTIIRNLFSPDVIKTSEWMSKTVRYEGNVIRSTKIKELFWVNFFDLNEKYERFENMSELRNPPNLSERNIMIESLAERCRVCYDLMVVDSREPHRETALQDISDLDDILHTKQPSVEVQRLLAIMESTEATDEMKQEAQVLLKKWNELNKEDTPESSTMVDMKNDLETIKRIVESKEM